MSRVLIDTSAWVQFFRHGEGPIADEVARLIEADEAWTTGPVVAELLHGTRSDRERRELSTLLETLSYADVLRADWEAVGDLLRRLREKGRTLPLSDALIASVAKRLDLTVLTLDAHFDELPARRWNAGEGDLKA
jgi:predicted nucleic acid-binding protein